ncbi:RidA family protein [Salmonella enterica]|nr:RidA family protein [Salmonella enterica]
MALTILPNLHHVLRLYRVKFGDTVMTSGQLPINPTTGKMSPDICQQTQQSLDNVLAIIKDAGMTASNIVKVVSFR